MTQEQQAQQAVAAAPPAEPRQIVASPRINHPSVQVGTTYEKGVSVLISGHPGCLDGETTVIRYRRGARAGSRPLVLEQLYRKFKGLKCKGTPWEVKSPVYTYSVDGDGVVFYNEIKDVVYSGAKRCVEITLSTGTVLICTPDHPLLTTAMEYVEAEHSTGCDLLMRGSMRPVKGGGKKRDYTRKHVYVLYHKYGCQRIIRNVGPKDYVYRMVPRARLVVEAHINGMTYDNYIGALRSDGAASRGFVFLPPEMEVHHRDGNKRNDARENLEVLSKAAHAKVHGLSDNFNTDYTTQARVISIQDAGIRETYDVVMGEDAPNFSANGVFVHNSWKSTWAAQWPGAVFLSVAAEGGDDSIKPGSFEPIIRALNARSQMPDCPPSFNITSPPVLPVKSAADFSQYIKDIVMNHKMWGVCTVVVDSLTYLIDLWIRDLIAHKEKQDANWMRQVKKRGGDFIGPPEWGLLNNFLAKARVDLGNAGLNVIWTTLQSDTYVTSGHNMQDRSLQTIEPMITGKNKVTLPGACKLHIWAEKVWKADDRAFGRQIVEPVFWTSSNSQARWVRHRYGLKFPQGKLLDPEFGTLPTFRAVWAELSDFIYTG